jgi:hypothetical protein
MKLKLLILIVLVLLMFISISFAASEGTVTLSLNSTKVWWNDTVNASGTAIYSNGTPISGTFVFKVNDVQTCSYSVDANGFWNCTFRAPDEIKAYTVLVNVTNATGYSFANSTILNVAPNYGRSVVGTIDRVVYEQPMLIQDLNGTIKKIWVRITTWRG